eukprot:ANDGO_03655.mRNA.1 Inositol monophosphatase 2
MSSESLDLEKALNGAVAVALEAGKLIKEGFYKPIQIQTKDSDGTDLVTATDRASEALIFSSLAKQFPQTAFLGEESAEGDYSVIEAAIQGSFEKYTWVIDPLDGTSNFCCHYPHSAVSIGLIKNGKPCLGVIYDPFREDLFTGCVGRGSFRNGRPLAVDSKCMHLKQALVSTNVPADRSEDSTRKTCDLISRLMRLPVRGVRMHASCALDLCYLAAGELTCYIEDGPWPWDTAAGAVILTEAGGVIYSLDGSEFDVGKRGLLAGNNAAVCRELSECAFPRF